MNMEIYKEEKTEWVLTPQKNINRASLRRTLVLL
jgi:hypothetical protein